MNQQYLIGVGLEYSGLSKSHTGDCMTQAGVCQGANQNYTISNRYSLFLTPSFVIDKERLSYLKIGYTNENIQSTIITHDANNGKSFGSQGVNGYVLGVGYKQIIQNSLYGFGEINYYHYSSASLNNAIGAFAVTANNPSPTAYNFIVGLGYKF